MKFEIKVRSGSVTDEHVVEMPAHPRAATSGRARFKLDRVVQEVDWAEVEPGVYSLIVGGRSRVVSVAPSYGSEAANGGYQATVRGRALQIEVRNQRSKRGAGHDASHHAPLEILAPMPGRIVKILAPEGAAIAAGRGLLVIEAMKMQNEIRAPRAGAVRKVHVSEGQGVEAGTALMSIG